MPDSPCIIKEYEPHNPFHRAAFADLNRAWLTQYFAVEPQDEEAFADPEGTVLEDGGVILVAEYDGMVVGTGSLLCMQPDIYEIAKMAVGPSYQGKGIGKQLLVTLIERARMHGASKLFIVSNTLLLPAIGLYRKHGFTESTQNHHQYYARGNITLERDIYTVGSQ